MTTAYERRRSCHVLRSHGIPSVVWFEDALRHYGVPTVLFDLYVLVPDIGAAARILEENGWNSIPQQHGSIGNAVVDLALHPQLRLSPPTEDDPEDQSVLGPFKKHGPPLSVLLPAAEWNYTFKDDASPLDFLPTLEDLVNGLIRSLLDASDMALQGHVAMQLGYLYDHAREVQERSFAERLTYENRQYHLDIKSGMNFGTVPFVEHQRKNREALRRGTCQLQECSATHDNEALFNRAVQARLLASMPSPFDENA